MMLFCGEGIKRVIPENRVFDIFQYGNQISIHYDNGEYVQMEDGTYVKKISTATVHYPDDDDATAVMREYFKACEKRKGAFFFG